MAVAAGTVVAIGMTSGLGPVGPSAVAAEPAPTPAHTVFQSDRYVPRGSSLISAGTQGFLRQVDGTAGFLWTRYSDGKSTLVAGLNSILGYPGYAGAGSDTVALPQAGAVELRGMADGSVRRLPLATGTYLGTYGETAVTYGESGSGGEIGDLRLHRFDADGSVVVQQVTTPPGARIRRAPLAADARTVVFAYADASSRTRLGLLSIDTGSFTQGPEVPATGVTVAVVKDRLAWYAAGQPIRIAPLDNPTAEPETRTMPGVAGSSVSSLGIVGDDVVVARDVVGTPNNALNMRGMPLVAVPKTGQPPRTRLAHADGDLIQDPNGNLLATGGLDAGLWFVHHMLESDFERQLVKIAPEPAQIRRISLANGTLATNEADSNFGPVYVTRTVTTQGAALSPGDPVRSDRFAEGPESGAWSAGNGRSVRMMRIPDGMSVQSLAKDDAAGYFSLPSQQATVLDITGRYAIVNGTDPVQQYVGDLGVHHDLKPIRTRPVTAASVWGHTLWTPSASAGVLTAENLPTGARSTLATGAPCVAKELQAVGRWIYWSCGPTGQAGVWDRTARKNIPVPSGEALIGDGYLVRHDKVAGKLLLIAFQDGSADETRTVGDLPGTAVNRRGVTWTVDKFGGPVAYAAEDKRIHLAPSGVPTQPVSAVEATASTLVTVGGASWSGRWLVSRPVAGWQVTVRDVNGKVVRTLSGAAPKGVIEAYWDGRTATGGHLPNGGYTWALTAAPANGQGPAFTASGPVGLRNGAPVRHDHVGILPDGIGDLLTLSGTGDFTFHGGGSGKFSGKTTGSGWSTSALAVPFGDLSGDRCNDVLIRLGTGELRAYRPGCGQPLNARTAYTSIGTGWGQYDVLTSPGDLNGDGRADLVARQKSTGDIYFYAGANDGRFAATRVRIGTNWKAYTKVLGVGDITGDGRPDLLAHDANGGLWRYEGAGNGTFKAGARVFSGWGRGYNALVGAGDITGDGRADLVARDGSGNLYRHNGTGTGTFAGGVRIGAGWQSYKLY
ncbi:FG-GAP-like repeat-containing protein [Streptomyces sp. NPDC001820]|uniref:FG-GAP-like repeat-containing protein n=1 Tax=Streptomyces sp. NPDC001820 TaxID=3364613 RepID=UPI0036B457BD